MIQDLACFQDTPIRQQANFKLPRYAVFRKNPLAPIAFSQKLLPLNENGN
jgi:hypothetical protein